MGEAPHGGRTRGQGVGLIRDAFSDRVMAGLCPGHLAWARTKREDRDARVNKPAHDDGVDLTPPNVPAPRDG